MHKNQLLGLTLKFSYLSVIGVYLLDMVFYSGFVNKHFFFAPITFQLIILIGHGLIRKIWQKKLSDEFVAVNIFMIAPISLALGVFTLFVEKTSALYPNYFFSNFKFDPVALAPLALPALSFGLIHASGKFIRLHWQKLVFLSTVVVAMFAEWQFLVNPIEYKNMVAEDRLVENLTALAFFGCGIIAYLMTKKSQVFQGKLLQKTCYVGCLILAICFFFIAGEEISWGQRIFHLQTPAAILAQNRQAEINLHNSEAIWPFVYIAYSLIAGYGAIMWIFEWLFSPLFPKNHNLNLLSRALIPKGYLFLNFAIIWLYVWLRRNHGPWKYQLWEELSELILVTGVLVHLLQAYYYLWKQGREKPDH